MDASTGALTFLGTDGNGVQDFSLDKVVTGSPGDGVLIAVDASKEYISKNQTIILTSKPWAAPRDLNE